MVSDNAAEAAETVNISASNGLSSFSTSYANKTITLSLGTPTSTNVAWSAYSADGQKYSLDLASGKFGVKKGDNYGHFNSYVAVLNIEVPQWLQDLAADNSLSVTVTGDYYCWRHRTMQDDAEFYFGLNQSASLLPKPINLTSSSVRDNLDEDSGTSFLPGYSSIHNQKIGIGVTAASETGTYSGSLTLSSTTKYIGIGLSGHADAYPGYATPESYIQNIKITIPYDGGTVSANNPNIEIKNDDYGSCSYIFYPNATVSSVGSPESAKTIAKGKSATLTTSNPFAFVLITPKESVVGYRFKNVTVNGGNQSLGYDATNDDAPNQVLVSTLSNDTLTSTRDSAYSGSYSYVKGSTAVKLNFTLRTYKIIYRANGGTGADVTKTYTYDEEYTVPGPADSGFNFEKPGSVSAGWKYATDNKTDVANTTYRGKQFTPGNTFKNIFPTLNYNTIIIYFDVAWVDAAPTNVDTTITKMEISAYTDKYSDVTFTITAKKDGHKLVQIYAKYTSGDINGEKIALEQTQEPNSSNQSKWKLYGISGNCQITAEWVTTKYTITYDWNSGTGTDGATSYYYGTTTALPFSGTRTNYTLDGWTLTAASGGSTGVTGTQYCISNKAYGNITATAVWKTTSVTPTNNANSTDNSPDTTGVDSGGFKTAIKGLGKAVKTGSSTFGETAETAVSQDVNLPSSILYALRAGATVKATLEGKLEIGTLNDNYVIMFSDPESSKAYGRIGLGAGTATPTYASYLSTAYAYVYDWDSSAQYKSGTQKVSNITLSQSDTKVKVYVQLKREKKNDHGDAWFYAILTSFTITYTVSDGTPLTITYNGNGGKTAENTTTEKSTYLLSAVNGSVTVTFPSSMFSRQGYEFLGWSTSNTAESATYKPNGTASRTSGTTYYAIWAKKKYPVNTYDVWTDGTNYGTTIRKQFYAEHEDNVYIYTSNSSATEYNHSKGSSTIHHLLGGGDYDGFTIDKSYRISSMRQVATNKYTYDPDPNYLTSPSIGGITGAIWGLFIWNLNEPTATAVNAEPVDYGTSVDLADWAPLITPSHPATDAEFRVSWDGNFYKGYEVFLVEESGRYAATVTVTVTRGGATLSKSDDSESLYSKVTINPLHLKVVPSEEGDRTYEYNGSTYEFPLKTLIDEDYYENNGYTDEQISYLNSVFETERSESSGRHPWYYDEEMETANAALPTDQRRNLQKWRYGLAVNLVGLGYSSYISDGTDEDDFYEGTVVNTIRQFVDAGTYWASILHILKATATSVSSGGDYNKNYVWTANADENNPQIFHANQAGAEGTVYATILPADGFDIYAFYAQKTFGKISDPAATPLELDIPESGVFDMSVLQQFWEENGNGNIYESRILAINGLLGSDFDLYANLIAQKVTRDTSAVLHQKAGLYDVYLDLTIEDGKTIKTEFLKLLNNYGVKLDSNVSTAVREGYATVKMYWVNKDGTLMSNVGFDFTTDVSEYAGERKNFEIVPKEISINNESAKTYTYNGYPRGPDRIITTGFLSETEKEQLFADYLANGGGSDEDENYSHLFNIYFYGIPLSFADVNNWKNMSPAEQAAYITDEDVLKGKRIVGQKGSNYVNGPDDKYAISLNEVNAGSYAVVIIGAAYLDANGNDHENDSFKLSEPLFVEWQITPISINATPTTASTPSMIFGDVNYGGVTFNFSNIVSNADVQDRITIENLSITFNGGSADGFIRYSALNADTVLVNGSQPSIYGTYAGDYEITMDGAVTVGMTAATGMYGVASDNYGRADSNYTLNAHSKFTIDNRDLTIGANQYTADGGTTFSTQIPDMTYVYGTSKGIKLTVSNLYDPNFLDPLTGDVAAKSDDDNVKIPASAIVDDSRISVVTSHENSLCSQSTDAATGAIDFTFTAINAATYEVDISKVTYTLNGVKYANYDLTATHTSFTIKPKTVSIQWYLDGNAVTGTEIPRVTYDGNAHTVSAQFLRADSGKLFTDDGRVYYDDYISATTIYSVYRNESPVSLTIDGEGNDTHTNVNVVNGVDTPFKTGLELKLFNNGNYAISSAEDEAGSYCLFWEITRRNFRITVTEGNNVYLYDGTYKQAVLNLETDGDVKVVLDNFNAIADADAEFSYSDGLLFNAANVSLSAVDVGKYEFSYDAGSGIKIDRNWLLTGSANYTGNDFLFAIIPRVLNLKFNTTSTTYTSKNLASYFTATYVDSVELPDDYSLTYDITLKDDSTALTEIVHAGTYTVKVKSLNTQSGNFVLAKENPTEWYVALEHEDGYYSKASVIAAYTADVTVNKYQVTLDADKINESLEDYVYDGVTRGYNLQYLYDTFVKSRLLCDEDKAGYTLNGESEAAKNVGTYTVKIRGFNEFNDHLDYRFALNEYTILWSITPRILTFKYDEYHSGGSGYSYDGNFHGYTLTIGNVVSGEAVNLTFSGSNLNVSSPLTVSAADGLTSKSFDIYGKEARNYSISDFALADATVGSTTFSSSNYDLPESGKNKSWTITKKVIAVTWHNTELTYRARQYSPKPDDPDDSGAYATVTNSVSSDSFTINYSGQWRATDAGTYTITIENLTGGASANYEIQGTLSTTWVIKEKEITEIAWAGVGTAFDGLNVTYDGRNHSIAAAPTAGAASADDGKIYDADAAGFDFFYSTASEYVESALLAGTYKTKISGCNSINYVIPSSADVEKEWKILQRTLTVTYKYNYGAAITYCASARGVVLEIGNLVGSDFGANLNFTVSTVNATDTPVEADNGGSVNGSVYTRTLRSVNAGTYTAKVAISATSVRRDCYTLSGTLNAEFEIVPLVAVLEWKLCEAAHSNRTAEYDGNQHELIATVSNLASSSDNVTVTVNNGKQTNQGTYTGVATSTGNANYALPEQTSDRSCTFTITPRTINAVWETTADSYVYNGKYQSDKLTLSRLVSTDKVKFKVDFYRITGGTSETVTTLLGTAELTKSGAVQYELTPDQFQTTINYGNYLAEFDGKVYNEDGTVNTNYKFTPVGDDDKTSYTISRATLAFTGKWYYTNDSVTAELKSDSILIYNAKSYVITTEINPASLFTRDDGDGSTLDDVSISYTGNVNAGAGRYTAVANALTGTHAANYDRPTANISATYEITPKPVDLVWENYQNLVYSGQTYTVTAKINGGAENDTDKKAYDGDSVSVAKYENNAYRNASTYTAKALSLDNGNYVIADNETWDWTIAPRPVTLSWSFATVEYDGTEKTVTATVTNRVSGDTVNLTYESVPSQNKGNKFTNKGTYTASVTQLSNANYTLTDGVNLTHEWKITPILLEFGWSSGGLVYNGTEQGRTLTVSNIADVDLSADKLSFVTALTPNGSQTVTETRTTNPIKITFKATNAGTYEVEITGLGGASKDNYELPAADAKATFVIAKRVVALSWSSDDFIYSKSEHAVTAEVTNVVGEDEINLTYSTEDERGSDFDGNAATHAGAYMTTVTAVDNSNYTITGANDLTHEWTIDPKTLTEVTFKLDNGTGLTAEYDRTAHTLTATAAVNAENAGTTDDGKLYYGDEVAFAYAGSVVTNYGSSAITRNSATTAGKYKVVLSVTGNNDYTVSKECEFTVAKRVLILTKEDVTTTNFVYNGKAQGVKITVEKLIADDNIGTSFGLDAETNPPDTVSAVRSGADYSRQFLATKAGTYTLTFKLSGSRASNYALSETDREFTIYRKEITTQISADVTADNITYRAEAIGTDDLSVTFNNLITGERLTLDSDFSVTFAQNGADLETPPINVGTYVAKISLKSNGAASANYELTGTTDFEFDIVPYEITPSVLSWTLDENTVNLTSLTYKEGENKTVSIGAVNDEIFKKVDGLGFSYVYFGLCNCGLEATSASDENLHTDHQWLSVNGNWRTDGPEHAGSYFVVITLSGEGAENFILIGFDDYTGNYFTAEDGETYITYNQSTDKFDDTPLPKLGDRVAPLRFGVKRLLLGVVVDATSSLPYKGSAYTVATGLPKVTEAAVASNIRVEVGSVTYTYTEYSADTFKVIKNAGEYSIRIYDRTATGDTTNVVGCDLFNSDAQMEVDVTLTVEKAKITITDTTDPYWTKEYDRTTAYTDFRYSTGVEFSSETDDDGNITAKSDGVLSGTTATVTAKYNDYNAGPKTLTFTINDDDRANYYLVFSENGELLDETEYTVSGYAYSIPTAKITKRVITVAGDKDKVFDGTDEVQFNVVSADVITGDTVEVTGKYVTADGEPTAHVGTHKIVLTASNDNYEISSNIQASGTISPAALTVAWTGNEASSTYDKQAHGVSLTVSGMLDGFLETVTASGKFEAATATETDGRFTLTSDNEYSFTAVNAGDYSVTLALGANSNYTLNSTLDSAEWHISPLTLEITWETDDFADGAYVYDWGENFTVQYSGIPRSITPKIENLVEGDGDSVTLKVVNNSRTLVGKSKAEVTEINGDSASNYALPTDCSQNFEIIKATITSIVFDKEKYEFTYNGTAQGAEISSYVTQHGVTVNVDYSGGDYATSPSVSGKNAFIGVTGESGKVITATIAESNYYEKCVLKTTVVINPSPITSITLTSRTFTYDKESHSLSVNKTVTDGKVLTAYDDMISISYTINGEAGNSAINAGTYTVVATLAGDKENNSADVNYVTGTRTATLTINKADIDENRITVNEDSGNVTYDKQPHGVTITVTDNQTQYADPVSITFFGGENNSGQATNAGRYEINAVISAKTEDTDNYNDYTTSTSVLNIIQKTVDLTMTSAEEFTYDGDSHAAVVIFAYGAQADDDGKVYTGDAVNVRLAYLGTSGAAQGDTVIRNSGTYTVTATLSNGNYKPNDYSMTVTVKKATIGGYYFVRNTVTYNNRLRYLSVNSENEPLSSSAITSVNLLSDDVGTVTYYCKTTADGDYDTVFNGAKFVGTYYVKATITATGDAAGNYEEWVETADLKIERSGITSFVMDELSATYDGLEHAITVSVPSKQLVNGVYYTAHGDAVNISYTITDNKTDSTGALTYLNGNSAIDVNVINGAPAAYTVTVHLSFDDEEIERNYVTDNLDISADLMISPARLTGITLDGANADYDKKAHNAYLTLPSGSGYPIYELNDEKTELTVKLADGHAGDVFTVNEYIDDFEGTSAIDAGTYEFVVQITFSHTNRQDAPKDASLKSNYTALGTLRKTIVISKADAADADGTVYEANVNVFFHDKETNGEITYCGGTHYLILEFTEDKSKLTHTASDVTTSITLHPEKNKDASDEANIVYTCKGAEFEGAKNAGVYEITATVEHKNYKTFTITGTINIAKAKIDYFFVGPEEPLIYDMSTHFAALSKTEAYRDESVNSIALQGSDAASISYTYYLNDVSKGKFEGALNVGVYDITATLTILGNAGGNYETWGTNGSKTVRLEITPYETAIIWNIKPSYVYNGENQEPVTATFEGADGSTVEMTVACVGISGKAQGDTVMKNAGVYTVTASHPRMGNYEFDTEDGETPNVKNVTVQKAKIVRYLVSESRDYSAKTYFLTLNSVNSALVTETDSTSITVFGETINVIYTYAKNGDGSDAYMNEAGVLTTLERGARNAGRYEITARIDLGDGESNFEDWTEAKQATLEISPRNLTATSQSNFEKEYDGEVTLPDCVISGVINDASQIEFVAEYSDKNAGNGKAITIRATTKDGYEYLIDNYVLPSVPDGRITPKELKLTDEQSTLEYWRKAAYDGLTATNHTPLTLTAANNVIKDDVVTLSSRYNSKNVTQATSIIFTLSGADYANYTFMRELEFSNELDFDNGVYLINPRTATITWSAKAVDYNGRVQAVTAYLSVLGQDVASGQVKLPVTLTYVKDGLNNTLTNPVENAEFKNAGVYLAAVNTDDLPEDKDEVFLANYGIKADDEITREFEINRVTLDITWSGLSATYTYKGVDQGSSVNATVTLLGDDVTDYTDYLIKVFTKNDAATNFRDAGTYSVTARFADAVSAELTNNYGLANVNRTLTMNRAEITNIFFDGADEWTYTDGTTHYYFVSTDNNLEYIVKEGSASGSAPAPVYEFDENIAMAIAYSGGDFSLDDVNGNNGVKNVARNGGARTVTATVASTANYLAWTGTITVTVLKGTIDNVVMESYYVTYDGTPHAVYAHNDAKDANGNPIKYENGKFYQVKAPDGTTVEVTYTIAVGTGYANPDFVEELNPNGNSAENAGDYLVEAKITGLTNYEDFTYPEEVALVIKQFETDVTWAFNKQTTPDFTYNATNQTSAIGATILGANTTGAQNRIDLAVKIRLEITDELQKYADDENLRSQFVIAGNYEMTADFVKVDDADMNYQKLKNNYLLSGTSVDVEMKKFTVEIKWYKDGKLHGEEDALYSDEIACVYNAEAHGVYAIGYGINDVPMDIETAIGEGYAMQAINAGKYVSVVKKIEDGEDSIVIGEKKYDFDYNLNYMLANERLEWIIRRREIRITAASDNFLSKIYDGERDFKFENDGYTRTYEADSTNGGVCNIKVTYTTLNSAAESKFAYYINNVMERDKELVFLPIASIQSDLINVRATTATVAFGTLLIYDEDANEFVDANTASVCNYVVVSASDGIQQSNENLITPRTVYLRFQNLSHVYNGESYSHEFTYADSINGGQKFYDQYGYELFRFYPDDSASPQRMQLVDKNYARNYLVGSINIGGNTDAGKYGYVTVDLKVVDAEADGAENYDIRMSSYNESRKYTIEKRTLAVNYDHLLQSLQTDFSNVTAALSLADSETEDLIIGEGETAEQALTKLVIDKDNFEISVNNKWTNSTYSAYTRIDGAVVLSGATPTEPLTVIISSDNYEINLPVLQITYLKIEQAADYKFSINNLDDLLHLDGDDYGLCATLEELGVEAIPTFTQTADIDGLVDGSYTVMPSIRSFRGDYDGGGYAIRNINSQPTSDETDGEYAGFFARIAEGSVSDVTFTDIHVYATKGTSSVGGFAGVIEAGVTVTNVEYHGTVYAYADYSLGNPTNIVKVGGFVGSAQNANVNNVSVAVKMNVINVKSDILAVGGMAGLINCGNYENISVFADISVKYSSAPEIDGVFGGIAGNAVGDELEITDYRYLASSVYANEGLCDRAFGSGINSDLPGKTYDDFIGANDGLKDLITEFMVRDYLLPSHADGTAAHPVEIANFRQVSLIIAYPYMNFKITGEIRSPLKISTYDRGFYGVIDCADGSIRSDHAENTSDISLFKILKDSQTVTIGKRKEE